MNLKNLKHMTDETLVNTAGAAVFETLLRDLIRVTITREQAESILEAFELSGHTHASFELDVALEDDVLNLDLVLPLFTHSLDKPS